MEKVENKDITRIREWINDEFYGRLLFKVLLASRITNYTIIHVCVYSKTQPPLFVTREHGTKLIAYHRNVNDSRNIVMKGRVFSTKDNYDFLSRVFTAELQKDIISFEYVIPSRMNTEESKPNSVLSAFLGRDYDSLEQTEAYFLAPISVDKAAFTDKIRTWSDEKITSIIQEIRPLLREIGWW